ncbi:MAG: hypothetical protein ACTSRE_10385 [Promethearchaeota archaeon]
MSKILHKKKYKDKTDELKRENKKNLISFIVMGIIQVVFLVGSFFLGRFIGYYEHNDALFYPYNRNAKLKGSLGLLFAGVANAIYIALNKRVSLKNKKWNLGMKVAIPLASWSVSEFIIYRLGHISSIPLWDHVSTLYGVYDRRKPP